MITAFLCCLLMGACNNEQKYDIKKDKYESTKETLAEIEQKTPERFLSVTGTKRKNVIGQTVIKGKILNKARVVTFKDVGIRLYFYSKTGALLERDDEVIYEKIAPGNEINFKSKFFVPKGADSLALEIISAQF